MPEVPSAGVYSSQESRTTAVPLVGCWSVPTSHTESPSGSTPANGTGMRVVCLLAAHAVRALGLGGLLASESGTTSKVTVEAAVFPEESMTE